MMQPREDYESVAVSSRVRLARNFKDYPFPDRLLRDPHAEEQASEIISLLTAELTSMEEFRVYVIRETPEETVRLLQERYRISRDLIRHRDISAALVSEDESISVMINEEDHIREQYFMKGLDLSRAYERISGIDEIISDSIPFAYDREFGYLTACPTNLGTGLRASAMLFLPASARRGRLKSLLPVLMRRGLTVRGVFGEGSGSEGDLFQISNEVTLGYSEKEILDNVDDAVTHLVEMEIRERLRMNAEEGAALQDRVYRSYGILTHCKLLNEKEFPRLVSDLKLGVALGYFGAVKGRDDRMEKLDELVVSMRPTGLDILNGANLTDEERDSLRAQYVADALRKLKLAD